jgi:hypothetical protein
MEQSQFKIGVKHGEFIVGTLVISGGGSAFIVVVKTYKAVNFVAKTYKRINSSPEELLQDSITAISDAF